MTNKVKSGNFKAAIHILCSEARLAPVSEEMLATLKGKHPQPSPQSRKLSDHTGNTHFTPLQVDHNDITKALKIFPLGSTRGRDGLTPQLIIDLLSGNPDGNLLHTVVEFVNFLLQGRLPLEVNEIIFGGRLIALLKKDCGIRLISIGYTLRFLVVKCANKHVVERRSSDLQTTQVAVGVPTGSEAVIHATRRNIEEKPTDYVTVKLDFNNAFDSVRRGLILDASAANTPIIYQFTYVKYSCEPKLIYGL